jgi:hypothetical protein
VIADRETLRGRPFKQRTKAKGLEADARAAESYRREEADYKAALKTIEEAAMAAISIFSGLLEYNSIAHQMMERNLALPFEEEPIQAQRFCSFLEEFKRSFIRETKETLAAVLATMTKTRTRTHQELQALWIPCVARLESADMVKVMGRRFTQGDYLTTYDLYSRTLVANTCSEAQAVAFQFYQRWKVISQRPSYDSTIPAWIALSNVLHEACDRYDPGAPPPLFGPTIGTATIPQKTVTFEQVTANLATTSKGKGGLKKTSSKKPCTLCGMRRGSHEAEQCVATTCFFCMERFERHDDLVEHSKECKKRKAEDGPPSATKKHKTGSGSSPSSASFPSKSALLKENKALKDQLASSKTPST